MSDTIILIPARMASTRLPGKPLADVCGRPMIVEVARRAFLAGIGLSFLLLRHVVFARPGKRFSLAYVAASHGLQLVLGLAVVEAWVTWVRGPAWAAPLVAAAICVPVMFALQRWIFTPHGTR